MLVHAVCLQLSADTSVSFILTNDAQNTLRQHLTLEIRTKLEGCCQILPFITVKVYRRFAWQIKVLYWNETDYFHAKMR